MKFRILSAVVVFCVSSLISVPLRAADPPSEAERLQNLENAVRQLQERNAQLENEVRELKSKSGPFRPMFSGPEQKATAESENKAVFTAPPPPPVDVHPGGSEYKLTLGGYIQMNFEDGDVSAFERTLWFNRAEGSLSSAPGADQFDRRLCRAIRL